MPVEWLYIVGFFLGAGMHRILAWILITEFHTSNKYLTLGDILIGLARKLSGAKG